MVVGLVFGGPSVEHDISLITASQIYASIDKKKYTILPIYYSKNKTFHIFKKMPSIRELSGGIKLSEEVTINRLGAKKGGKFGKIISLDCVVGAFHGKNTEGGELAGFFETLGIPYSFNSVLGASIGQDKIIMKKVLKNDQISILPFVSFSSKEFKENEHKIIEEINELKYPIIIKPSMLGSSIGIKKINDESELKKAINNALKYDDFIIVEKALENYREFNCAIIENLLSDVEEVVVNNDIFTFEDKYQTKESKHILPAEIPIELQDEIYDLTVKTSNSLRNESIARIDFLYDNNEKKLYVNEINTIPGALAYYLFESKGIYFDELLDKLINLTMKRDYKKKLLLNHFNSNVLNNQNGLKMKK